MKSWRSSAGVLAFALTTAAVPFVTGTPAAANGVLTCTPSASIFAHKPSSDITLYQHDEPENGNQAWQAPRDIGEIWPGVTLGGPNGEVWHINTAGRLNRYRWLGNGWENNGQPEVVKTGATGWTPGKITMDAAGEMYGLHADGSLHWYRFTKQGTAWTTTERTVDTGWGDRYDLIWAGSEPGSIFARTRTGGLDHYLYHSASQRWVEHRRLVESTGWGPVIDVASVGGGVFYTRRNDTGKLHWYRYTGNDRQLPTWTPWAEGSGKVVDGGWPADWQIEGVANSCSTSAVLAPPRPVVPANVSGSITAVQQPDGRTAFFYVNSQGKLTTAKQRDTSNWATLDYQAFNEHDGYTGVPGAAVRTDNRIEVLANSSADAELRGKTQATANGVWPPNGEVNNFGGFMVTDPIVVTGADKSLTIFAADAQRRLHVRTQTAWGFSPWTVVPGEAGVSADFSVVRTGTALQIVSRRPDSSVRVAKYENGALGPWRLVGTDTVGKPAAVAISDSALQVFVRRTDNRIYTQTESGGAFPGTWTPVHSTEFAGSPAAVLRDTGHIELAARGADGLIHIASQLAPGGAFAGWTTRVDFDEAVSDPTGTVLLDGRPLFTWRAPAGLVATAIARPSAAESRGTATNYTFTTGQPG